MGPKPPRSRVEARTDVGSMRVERPLGGQPHPGFTPLAHPASAGYSSAHGRTVKRAIPLKGHLTQPSSSEVTLNTRPRSNAGGGRVYIRAVSDRGERPRRSARRTASGLL